LIVYAKALRVAIFLPPLSSRREEWGRWIAAHGGKTVGVKRAELFLSVELR
jgi:hypothetical protein